MDGAEMARLADIAEMQDRAQSILGEIGMLLEVSGRQNGRLGLMLESDDGSEYQGRVKVAIYCLDAWFYAARYEGISIYDMWLKAQKHHQKLWICYSKTLEEWDHEPYI
ncbi:hypothetical protein NOR_07706 [Metarhizium rileyi]|uniref:Uncharacterized protein n=1 Tax=Metarhizium rileyi (strain RCEF 4871) TaxID=1649241 RepID=A0A166XRI7_METRR|nr:hypothetical protein NOR_07706 [Metarhizium rileyi RCEF 4871]